MNKKWSKGNKYGARKAEYNGMTFDSQKEADHASSLDLLRRATSDSERVVEVEYQVPYEIVIKGKKCFKYYADFRVTYADGRVEVQDVKGYKKGQAYQMFRLKKKCVEAEYGIEIIEI